jgi:hypothetical protein
LKQKLLKIRRFSAAPESALGAGRRSNHPAPTNKIKLTRVILGDQLVEPRGYLSDNFDYCTGELLLRQRPALISHDFLYHISEEHTCNFGALLNLPFSPNESMDCRDSHRLVEALHARSSARVQFGRSTFTWMVATFE